VDKEKVTAEDRLEEAAVLLEVIYEDGLLGKKFNKRIADFLMKHRESGMDKFCSRCYNILLVGNFWKNGIYLSSWCKKCHNEYHKEHPELRDKKKMSEYHKKWMLRNKKQQQEYQHKYYIDRKINRKDKSV